MENGKVKWFNKVKGFGFITATNGEDVFVHLSDLQMTGIKTLVEGQQVAFTRAQTQKGMKAVSITIISHGEKSLSKSPANLPDNRGQNIRESANSTPAESAPIDIKSDTIDQDILSEDIEELDTNTVEDQLLHEIAGWKREAKAEDNERYFWHVREVKQIARGEKYFVIGRKGAGKTAICEYFNHQKSHDVFAEKLSFKNFPFNELYDQKNTKYTPPNQFISIWKYLIYSTVCRLMLKNESIDTKLRDQLSQLYGTGGSLPRRIGQWIGKEFGISLFGLSIKVSKQLPTAAPDNWTQNLDFLEDLVLEHAGNATYYVLFDELDEDYRDIVNTEQYQQYTALITSLFKAVQDVRTTASSSNADLKIYPVIFLRDDIYELVQDADKNKWGDFKVDLNWDTEKIKKVLAFRISRAINANCQKILSFDNAWAKVFGKQPIRAGSGKRKSVNTFEFIARSTLLRPRDFVAYLQNCAQLAEDECQKISPSIVRRVDKAFSNYLKDELIDELFAILPDISQIFDAISQLRKWNFSIPELERAYSDKVKRGFIKDQNVKSVLQILFLFSIIGNTPRSGRYVFRYQNRDARLNFNERLVVHRGLFKALQII